MAIFKTLPENFQQRADYFPLIVRKLLKKKTFEKQIISTQISSMDTWNAVLTTLPIFFDKKLDLVSLKICKW